MCQVYRALLVIYPPSYRREYGELMVQLFRDQCSDAQREGGTLGLLRMYVRVSGDLLLSVFREHSSTLTVLMKNLGINKLSILLAGASAVLTLVAGLLAEPRLIVPLLDLAALTLLVRAGVEWFRESGEWLKGLGWAALLFVAYGIFMPWLAKILELRHNSLPSFSALVLAGAVHLNMIVALIKSVIGWIRRPKTVAS